MIPASWNAFIAFFAEASVMPLFMSFKSRSSAHSSPPVTAMHPAFAISFASSGVNEVSKRMFPHHSHANFRRMISLQTPRINAGGIASSTKWNEG